jgi:deoxyadenosine/deoxycytidine kinase
MSVLALPCTAAGKSTFLDLLGTRNADFCLVQEPVHKWTSVEEGEADSDEITASQKSGGNLLGLFYKDSERWAYTFQTYAFLSRMKSQMKHDTDTECVSSVGVPVRVPPAENISNTHN